MQRRILIIEDEENLLELYEALFKISGFIVFTAVNGAEGLKKYNEVKPHIIFSDIDLPFMNGLDLLEAIFQEDKATIFFLNSGIMEPEREERAKKINAGMFEKPVKIQEVLQAIEEACKKIN